MAFMKKYTPVLTFIVVAFFVAFSFIAPGNHLSSLAVRAGTTTLSLTSEAKPTIEEGKGTLALDENMIPLSSMKMLLNPLMVTLF